MPRLLLVGSSHAVRVRSALEREMYARSPDSQVLVLGKGGLRADESVTYIERHVQQIVWYEPSHVVVHVGHCDLLPINVQEMGKPLTKVICDLEKIRDKLSDIVPNAKFAISEMFPHPGSRACCCGDCLLVTAGSCWWHTLDFFGGTSSVLSLRFTGAAPAFSAGYSCSSVDKYIMAIKIKWKLG